MRKALLCPSAACRPNALLLGIVNGDGTIWPLQQPVRIDREFVEIANRGRRPEKRFRFASPCVQSACQQWSGSRCGVIDLCAADVRSENHPLAREWQCPIRSDCRWFHQNGRAACEVCPEVITDASESWAQGDRLNAGDLMSH